MPFYIGREESRALDLNALIYLNFKFYKKERNRMRRKAPFKVLSSLAIAAIIGCTSVMSAPLAYAETPAKRKKCIYNTN